MRIILTALVLVPWAASRGEAQSFVLKKKLYPAAGKSVVVDDTDKTRSVVAIIVGDKVVNEETKVEVVEKQFTEKVVEAGDTQPAKYTWAFGKAVRGKEGEPGPLSYAGKTILFERRRGVCTVKAEDDGVDPKDLDLFAKDANRPDVGPAMLLKNAVKVGDTWSIGKEVLEGLGGAPGDFDVAKFKATGKLVKAYKQGDQQRGVIEIAIVVPMKKLGPLVLDQPIDLQVKSTYDTAIDGSSTVRTDTSTFTIKGRSQVTQDDQTFVIDVAITGETRRVVGAEK